LPEIEVSFPLRLLVVQSGGRVPEISSALAVHVACVAAHTAHDTGTPLANFALTLKKKKKQHYHHLVVT
jgi:hypothetical protein